ncbi:MAG: hypothetical protein P8J20_06020 [Novosphingobium sp.]|nr:hypothetical protein [Novosphingobium sp.]
MHKPIIAAAAFLIVVPGIAQAAEPPCLTKSEFSALASFGLPSVISGANERCSPTLSSGAFLPTQGDALVETYASRKDANWPAAKSAFLKISGKTDGKANDLLKLLPDDTLQAMLDVIVEGMVSQEIPIERCGIIDDFARLFAPLPPENTAELLALVVGLAGKPKKDGSGKSAIGKLAICED